MRNWLLQKLTRERLAVFLEDKGTDDIVLEIGAQRKPNRTLFPNVIAGDILYYPTLDAQFDAHQLPFPDNHFSGLVCIEVLEHCHTPQRVLEEFHRVLKSNGRLILSTRFVFPIHDAPHDYYRYTKYGLRHLMQDFSEVRIEEEAPTVVTMGVLLQRLAYQCDWRLPLTKVGLLLMAKLMPLFQRTLSREYGDIRKDTIEEAIMSSGYYVEAIK